MIAHALTATAVLGFWTLCGFLVFQVPKYEQVFKTANAKLPLATALVLQASALVQAYWIPILLAGTIGIVAVCLLAKGVSGMLGAITSALVCALLGLGLFGCYAALELVTRELSRQLG